MNIQGFLFVILIVVSNQAASAQNAASSKNHVTNERLNHPLPVDKFLIPGTQLSLKAAFILTETARNTAVTLGKQVSVAILDQSGVIVLLSRGDGVGPHNTEAARRKAYTALSTKTATLILARNARKDRDSENLVNLPELLLLGGGVPLLYNHIVVGSIGVAGGGGAVNDDSIARSAAKQVTEIITNNN